MPNQQNLFEDEFLDEGIPNPFYDPQLAEMERLFEEEWEREYYEREKQKQAEMASDGLEYQICCAHVSCVDGSAYAVEVLEDYEPKYVVYPDGLPEGVVPKRCDCGGKSAGWRGGEMVNRFYDEDKEKGNAESKKTVSQR